MKKTFAKCLLILTLSASSNLVHAEISTDGTMGTATSLNGPNFTISEQLGKLAGDNLFHSFNTFNIHSGETATFTGNASIKNVINRVTGGDISTINGHLISEIGSQGFYFINPAGVFFGPNSSVNVPASFHVSTADEIQFSDGKKFSASNLNYSSISVESPEAFGFSGGNSAKITFDSSRIQLNDKNTLSIVAGELEVNQDSANLNSSFLNSQNSTPIGLTSPEGEIRLIAHGQEQGTVSLSGEPGKDHIGNLDITGARVSVAGNGSGSIIIRGGDTQLINANFIMDNMGENSAPGGLDLYVQNLLMESKNLVDADALSEGHGAKIEISAANSITINDSTIDLVSKNSGNGGDITISAPSLFLNNGTKIITSTNGKGDGGNIYINATDLVMDGGISDISDPVGVLIATESLSEIKGGNELTITEAEGNGGNINIVANNIDIVKTAKISTSTFAKGDAGKITITASNLNIDSEGFLGIISPQETGIYSDAGVYSETVTITDPNNTTVLPGTDIEIPQTEEVTKVVYSSGNAGDIELIISDKLSLANGGEISSSTLSLGNAGQVNITAQSMLVDKVFKYDWKVDSNNTYIPYNLWDITEGEFVQQANGGLFSSSAQNATGNAGLINIDVDDLTVSNGGTIESSSSTIGQAGSIHINANLITLNQAGLISIKGQDSSHTNNTPTLTINTNELVLDGESNISSQSGGRAPASDIIIHSDDGVTVTGLSQISSEAENADSGSITISGSSLLLDQGLITTSVGRLADDGTPIIMGDGGDLTITSDALIMSNGFIQANTQGVEGRGGAIFIDSDQVITAFNSLEVGGGQPREFVPDSGKNIIQAAAPEGTPGEINISSPIDDVTSIIHAVDSSFKPLIVLADNPCQVESGELPSSLIFSGRGATPQSATDTILLSPADIAYQEYRSNAVAKNKLRVNAKSLTSLCSR